MGSVTIRHGCIRLHDGNRVIPLSAEAIFAVAFEGATSIQRVSLTFGDLASTGLQFSPYTADPIVVLRAIPIDHPSNIECRLIAKGANFEAEVSQEGDVLLDYAIDGAKWMPLPKDFTQAADSFLKSSGLETFGSISFGQYLHILQLRDSALVIEDRTHQAFSASQLAPTLTGELPAGFTGSLYPYQVDGYRWLVYMRNSGLGSIIADEMGLGKTVQVICLLVDSKNHGRVPCLVVTPATLLENWRREIIRFAPGLKVQIHRGSERTGFPDDLRAEDVVLTSYETAVADISLLRNLKWDLLIIDEAQAIKNPAAKRSRKLKTLTSRCAIAMTGTPVENHLTDLWSITDFVVPSLLGTLAEFEKRHPDTTDGASTLEPFLTPLILRRQVADVAKDLPPRIDIPQPLELDYESATVYETLRATAASTGGANLSSLVTLRMFCTHPWLASQFTHVTSAVDCSAKLQRLLEVMEEIVSENGKALIFTSYQQSVDLLSRELAAAFGIQTDVIDGRTPVEERQPKVDRFAMLRSPAALVLNPKAAGTGLNITAANHVIHFNLEWNPAVEDQASARAHRRGQTRAVTVHRFFYIHTVEDVINDRMERKRQLASIAVVGTDGAEADIQDLLQALRVSPAHRDERR